MFVAIDFCAIGTEIAQRDREPAPEWASAVVIDIEAVSR
jgi:hypothetical protein